MFDGHGGGACAQVISKRLFHYITACLLPHETLTHCMSTLSKTQPLGFIQAYNDNVQFVDDVKSIYEESFLMFLKDLLKVGIQ